MRRWFFLIGGVLGFCIAVLWTLVVGFRVWSGEYAFTKSFEKVSRGLYEQKILDLLGNPDEKGNKFRLGQYDGFEKAYKRAADRGAKYYWFWYRGLDIVYAVGFDEQGRVVVAECGGT